MRRLRLGESGPDRLHFAPARTRPDRREVPGLEADLRRRRSRPQPEIALRRVHEQRVGDAALLVLTGRLPLGEGHRAEEDRLAGSIPVQVAVEGAHVAPGVLAAIVPDGHPVGVVEEIPPAGQLEPADAAPLELGAGIQGEDVVLRRDVAVVVREHGPVLAAVDEVLPDQQVVGTLVRVDPLAAVVPPRDIVDDVEGDAAPRGAAGVNPGEVAEHALADVVDVVVFDDVAGGLARPEILDRAHGDARVEQVVDVVVDDPGTRRCRPRTRPPLPA